MGTGKAAARVPSVLGLSDAEARDNLRAAGFDVRPLLQREPPATDANQRLGQVWKQSPAAGASAVQGTTVTIWVNPDTPVNTTNTEETTTTM